MSAINIFSIDCENTVCPNGTLGAAGNFDLSCLDAVLSQLKSIVMWHPTLGNAPTNWGPSMLVTDFDIDNTDATDAKQKRFPIIGSLGKPEYQKIPTVSFAKIVAKKTRQVNFRIYHTDDATYDFLRKVECNKVRPRFILETEGGKLLGKDGGISVSDIELDAVWNEGETEVEYWEAVWEYQSNVSPDRIPSPLPDL